MRTTTLLVLLCFSTFLASFTSVSAENTIQYRVTAHYSQKIDQLYLRGSRCGLNWYNGLKMNKLQDHSWTVDLNCNQDVDQIEMKVLINDTDWMEGANAVGKVGGASWNIIEIYPWFYTTKGTL